MRGINLKILFLFIVIGLATYVLGIENSFIFDDDHTIVRNVFIRNIHFFPYYLKGYITSVTSKVLGIRPLLMLSFNINYLLFGYNPWGYRLVNIIIHILNAWVIYLIVLKLFPRVRMLSSVFAGLLFLIHPVNVEAVSYISSRSDLLVTFFVLLSFYYFLVFEEKYKSINQNSPYIFIKSYLISLSLYIAALLTKELAISLCLFLIMYVFLCNKRDSFAVKLRKVLPFLFFSVLYIGYRFYIFHHKALGISSRKEMWLNILTQARVSFYYLRLFMFPDKLSIDHQNLIINNPYELTPLLILILFVTLILGIKCYRWPNFKIGGLWYLSFLVPKFIATLNFPAMEHHFYLPSIGIYIFFVLGIERLFSIAPRNSYWGLLALYFLLGTITFKRNLEFRDERTVLESAVKVNPRAVYSIYRLGVTYEKMGEYNKALNILNNMFSAGASYDIVVQTLVQIADIYRVLKDYSRAEYLVFCSLKLKPDYPPAFHQLGLISMDKGEHKQARIWFKKELGNAIDKKECLIRVGDAFYVCGDYNSAIEIWRELQKLEPHDYRPYTRMAEIMEKQGKINQALSQYQRAVELYPFSYFLHFKLGTLYALNDDPRAENEFRTAIKLNPRTPETYYNLGLFYLSQGKDLNIAKKYLQKAKRMGYKLPGFIVEFLEND